MAISMPPSRARCGSGEFFARSGFFGFCNRSLKGALLSARDSGLYECDSKQTDSSAVVISETGGLPER
jgi:hypothetical protein